MADYIPGSDAQFDEWLEVFNGFVTTYGSMLGVSAGLVTALNNAATGWDSAYDAHQTARNAASAAKAVKDQARAAAVALARQIAQFLQNNPIFTDEQRALAGLTVPGQGGSGGGESLGTPLLLLDWSQRGRVVVHFGTNPGNERLNKKPFGVRGAKLWYHVGGIPSNDAAWQWLADDTASPYLHALTGEGSLTVAYRAQYFDTHMGLGPFSDPAVATVTF